jgi:Skp family chaperone for outer membrane proteins
MKTKTLALRGVTALALMALATATQAQSSGEGAAPPLPPPAFGPAIAGVCGVSQSRVLGESAVGKSFSSRMDALKSQVISELQPQETELASEQKTLSATASPDPAQVNAFNQKVSDFRRLQEQRSQELEATYQKQLRRLQLELRPVLVQAFQEKHCSLLLDEDSAVLIISPEMDLSPAAVLGLNAKIQTITFDRELMPAGGAAGGAPGQ